MAQNGPLNKQLNFGGDQDHGSGSGYGSDPYRDTGKTCLRGGMHYPTASSLLCICLISAQNAKFGFCELADCVRCNY